MAQDEPFEPDYTLYHGSSFLHLEETPLTYEPLASNPYPTACLTEASYALSFEDPILSSTSIDPASARDEGYPLPNAEARHVNPFYNTYVSSDGCGLENDQAEQRKEKVQDPCLRCQIKKKRCSPRPHRPCERCSKVKIGSHHGLSESELERWINQIPCFALELERLNPFKNDPPIASSPRPRRASSNCAMINIGKILRINGSLAGNEVLPPFLEAVGTFLAANTTPNPPYIQPHQSAEALHSFRFQLGICIVVIGLKWKFFKPLADRGEIDLPDCLRSFTNERMISFIRPQLLERAS